MPYKTPSSLPTTLSSSKTIDPGSLPEWDLSDLYPSMDSEAYEGDMASVLEDAITFEKKYTGKLERLAAEDTDALADSIHQFEQLEERVQRLISFAMLVYVGDSSNAKQIKFYGDAQEKLTAVNTHLLFYKLELNRIDDRILALAIRKNADLKHFSPWLEDLRKHKPYQLEDQIEKLFHEKSVSGYSAWNRLFDETMAALRFNINGKKLTSESAFDQLQSADREKRRNAAREIAQTLTENIRTFTLITNVLAKDKEISDRWRGYEDVADSRHLENRVERRVVNTLVETVRSSFPDLSHRYHMMKARWLGLEKMQYWDRNAPLPGQSNQLFSWEEARNTILDAYGKFSPKMADMAKTFFDKKWIDAPVREGKASGAFAHPTVPSVHPYILVNYQGRPRDVMTLAHELGHGVHQLLAGVQGKLMASTPLTLAETASVFGEMLTFRSLMDQAESAKERQILLAQKVEDMLNTVVRQIAFYTFEHNVHEERRKGELTSEQIGQIWMDVQRESLGPAFEFEENYSVYWSYIPHFIHSPFYVYAYAFGDCLVNSLFAVYQSGEIDFEKKYLDLLEAGGSRHYSELLAPFGLDASHPDFWSRGLGMITSMIDEIEKLDM